MSLNTFANMDSFEGTASGAVTINLTRKSRRIIITNDDSSAELQFRFSPAHSWATLKGTETISMDFITKVIYLNGNAAYRVWSTG